MFCTPKEQETCDVEKRGCEGCYYMNEGNKLKNIEEILELCREELPYNEDISATLDCEDLKSLECLYKIYQQEKEKNKKLEEVIDMMAEDLVKVPTNDYMSETQQEIARYINKHLKEKKETIKQYYFKKAGDRL